MTGTLSLLHAGPQVAVVPTGNPGGITTAPVWWLKADAGTYSDTARTSPATADGATVQGWADQSTSAKHLTQSVLGKALTLKLTQQNGLPSLRFDGVDDFMDAGSVVLSSATAWTIIAVHKTSGDCGLLSPATGANHQVRLGQSGGNTLSLYDGANNPISATLALPRSGWRQDTWQSGPHFWSKSVNYDAGGTMGALTLQRLGILSDSVSLPTKDDVGEILVYNVLLGSSDRAAVESYAQSRWAV